MSKDRTLIVAVHDGTDQLAIVHIAESDDEVDEVIRAASSLGPVWNFPLDDEPLQWRSES